MIFLNYDGLVPRQVRGHTATTHRIAREVAHGSFAYVAKITSNEEPWLGESLADYTPVHCLNLIEADPKGRCEAVQIQG